MVEVIIAVRSEALVLGIIKNHVHFMAQTDPVSKENRMVGIIVMPSGVYPP